MNKYILRAAMLALIFGCNLAKAAEPVNLKVEIKLQNIHAGSFYMGSCKITDSIAEQNKKRAFMGQPQLGAICPSGVAIDPNAEDTETPQHRVTVQAFEIGINEVSLGQFKVFIMAAGRNDLLTEDFIRGNSRGEDAPVTMVSWNDAQDYIAWLNTILGADGGFRLPTEAEWEYAARAGSTSVYSFGDSLAKLKNYAWYTETRNFDYKNPGLVAAQSGLKKPNAFGLYNMHGNVEEWTQDCWHYDYDGAPSDGRARETDKCQWRVLRGGWWSLLANGVRSASRSHALPDVGTNGAGFRIARTVR